MFNCKSVVHRRTGRSSCRSKRQPWSSWTSRPRWPPPSGNARRALSCGWISDPERAVTRLSWAEGGPFGVSLGRCRGVPKHDKQALLLGRSVIDHGRREGVDETSIQGHVGSMAIPEQPSAGSAAPQPSPGTPEVSAQTEETAARGGKTEPGAGSGGTELAELRRRVAALEAEHARLLAGYAANIETENARLRFITPPVVPEEAVEPSGEPLSPPYLGRALVAIEDHLADMERFVAIGDDAAARQSKVAAVLRACSTLRRLCCDDDFVNMLITMQEQATQQDKDISLVVAGTLPPQVSGAPSNATFRDAEIQLLKLAGLPEMLAQTHVDGAIAAYHADPVGSQNRIKNTMILLGDLRQLRDASCLTADLLSQGIRNERSRQRWKKLLTFGLGGTVIVAVNGVGTALLGPAGVAASGAIGSAAVGVAVQLVS
jgi:hypothetical protein